VNIDRITHFAGAAIQQKLAQENLQRSEAYLAQAEKLTHTGSWAWDPRTDKVLYCSEEMYRIFDLLRRHRRWQEFVPRRGSRWGRRHRAAAEVVAGPGGSTVREYAALSDRDGGLRGRASSQPQDARLMPARYVRPYSKGQKNDFRDAEAIAEAVQRPTMRFVATKTAEQLDLQGLHRVRERLAVCPSITDLSEMRRHDKDHAGLLQDIAEAFLHGFEHKTQTTEATCSGVLNSRSNPVTVRSAPQPLFRQHRPHSDIAFDQAISSSGTNVRHG